MCLFTRELLIFLAEFVGSDRSISAVDLVGLFQSLFGQSVASHGGTVRQSVRFQGEIQQKRLLNRKLESAWTIRFNAQQSLSCLQFLLMVPVACIRLALLIPTFILLFATSFFFYYLKLITRPSNYHEVKRYFCSVPMFFMNLTFFILGVRVKPAFDYSK